MRIQQKDGVLSIQVSGRWIVVGTVRNRTLVASRNKTEHFMRIYNGYGFNYELVADGRFFDYILLEEYDAGEVVNHYLISREDLLLHGVVDQMEKFDKQVFISVDKMTELNQMNQT